MRIRPISLAICTPSLKQARPLEVKVRRISSLLQPLLFLLGDSTVSLRSVLVGHILWAQGSEGLWKLS